MVKVAVFGGGWAGCAAAIQAKKNGAEVELVERTDMLLGTGLVGGIVRNNGRYTAAEELKSLGAPELVELIDNNCVHTNIDFPHHKHSSFYNVSEIEADVRGLIHKMGIKTIFQMRGKEVNVKDNIITSVLLDDGTKMMADVFIDATGSAGPMENCVKYGHGCAMCIYRCPTFGGRISITEKAGIKEYKGRKMDGTIGIMSGSCKLIKESLAKDIQDRLNEAGVCIVPVPKDLQKDNVLDLKVCKQYSHEDYQKNIILLDCGHVKMMAPFYPLSVLRNIPGFEKARYADPISGGVGNSIRLIGAAPRDNKMQVKGAYNLFCAGEKSGLLVGHMEAIATGTLAGYNAVRYQKGQELLELPRTLAIGEGISLSLVGMEEEIDLERRYTFSGSQLFEKLKEKDLYSTDIEAINTRVNKSGLAGVFNPNQ